MVFCPRTMEKSACIVTLVIAAFCGFALVMSQDQPDNPCVVYHPCQNGGTCVNFVKGDYYCVCPASLYGSDCHLWNCMDPGAVSNGQRTPPAQAGTYRNHSSVISFSCNSGYLLKGSASILCSNGTWNATSPSCERRTCPYPNALQNGTLIPVAAAGPLRYTDTVNASCDPAYSLNGSAVRQCMANGQLSGTPPLCVRSGCFAPTAPANGMVLPSAGSVVSFGQSMRTSCGSGYLAVGSTTRQCMPTGLWNGTPVTCPDFCSNATCPEDTSPTNTTWTSCCKYAGKSVQCCRPGVQEIIDDRYNNVTNTGCRNGVRNTSAFQTCISSLITCLSNAKGGDGSVACSDIHGCFSNRFNSSQCLALYGAEAILCNSTVFEKDIGLSTPFCLPASCGQSLVDLAASDYATHCNVLTGLAGLSKCPILRVEITCPGSNGTFSIGNNPPSGEDGGGTKPGIIALAVILAIIGLAALVFVAIFVYRMKKKDDDAVDFHRLQADDDEE